MVQMVKNLPAMWDTWVRSLGQEDPLEEGMATHSGILAREIPWTEDIISLLRYRAEQGIGLRSHKKEQIKVNLLGFPRLSSGYESTLQCRGCWIDPWLVN